MHWFMKMGIVDAFRWVQSMLFSDGTRVSTRDLMVLQSDTSTKNTRKKSRRKTKQAQGKRKTSRRVQTPRRSRTFVEPTSSILLHEDGQLYLASIFDDRQTTVEIDPKSKKITILKSKGIDPKSKKITNLKSNVKVEYKKERVVGEGTSGTVWKYTITPDSTRRVDSLAHHLALKLDTGNVDENSVIRAMKKKNTDCKVVQLRGINIENAGFGQEVKFAYLMQMMDSDLSEWISSTSDKERLRKLDSIIGQLKAQMDCLLKVNSTYAFADLKPKNVGVVRNAGKSIEAYLIDLGSVIRNADTELHVSTYPCFEETYHGEVHLLRKDDSHFCNLFGLFILIMHIVHNNADHIINRYAFDGTSKIPLRTKAFFVHRLPYDIECLKNTFKDGKQYEVSRNILDRLLGYIEPWTNDVVFAYFVKKFYSPSEHEIARVIFDNLSPKDKSRYYEETVRSEN